MLFDFNDPKLLEEVNPVDDYYRKYEIGMGDDYSGLMGDDTVYGPNNIERDQSLIGRLMDGNDHLQIYNGLFNDMNTNQGNDTIALFGGGGSVRGGKDNDVIEIYGGFWNGVNGNMGNDKITNFAPDANIVRGGQGDDTLINAGGGGNFYGDRGADTFRPYAYDDFGNYGGAMIIWDFEPGVDTLDLSTLGSGVYSINVPSGNTIVSVLYPDGFDQIVAVVEGVHI